jgi:segregation and condensation protein A
VTFNIFGQAASQYQISTEVFSGPLDLLLQLIERTELDITRLSLARVTDQYLEHLHTIRVQDPIEVSAFLVIAARLVLIKSLVLLPRNENITSLPEEDPGEILARQLIIYKKFKEIALFLRDREDKGFRTYLRMARLPKLPGKFEIGIYCAEDLARIYSKVISAKEPPHPLSQAVTISAITVRQRIDEIVSIIKSTTHSTFRSLLLSDHTRLEIIVTFLALLELIKHHSIFALQENPFADIQLESTGDLNVDIEPEF